MKEQTLLMVVVFGLIALLSYGVTWFASRARNWWKAHKAREDIQNGIVPIDYQLVVDEQERVNKVYAEGSLAEQMDEDFAVRESALTRIRQNVAYIRDAGFTIAYQSDVSIDKGLAYNPFKKGSGESKQWVRGYCMGANIIDIKPYMDKA